MGSCCTKSSQLGEIVKPLESGPQFARPDITTYISLSVDSPYSHCNVIVWTKTLIDFGALFPNTFQRVKIENSDISFNLVSYHSYKSDSPLAVDAVVWFLTNEDEYTLFLSLFELFNTVCIHIIVSQIEKKSLDRVIWIQNKDEIFLKILEQQENLEKLIRQLFTDVSNNFNFTLTVEELFESLKKEHPNVTQSEVSQLVQMADKDNDGKISFNEFSYWWKRGRQKRPSFLNLTKNWADRINFLLPKMNNFSGKKEINKNTKKKIVKIGTANCNEGNFEARITIGKSGKREELLQLTEQILSLNIDETWITFVLTGKTESDSHKNLLKIEHMTYFIKSTILNSGDIGIENLRTSVKPFKEMILFSFIFDLVDPEKIELLKFIEKFRQILKSPNDDYFSLELLAGERLSEITKRNCSNFSESIRNGFVKIESEHWSKYGESTSPNTDIEILVKDFLLLEGEMHIESISNSPFAPIQEYLKQILQPVNLMSKYVPLIKEVLQILNEKFDQKLLIYFRYLNLGFEIVLKDPELIKFIKDIE